jgi:hypothetical protein
MLGCLVSAGLGLAVAQGISDATEALVASSSSPPPSPPSPPSETGRAPSDKTQSTGESVVRHPPTGLDAVSASKPCRTDADCTLVPEDCCGCTEGGAARAVAKKRAEGYERARRSRCGGTMCAEMMSQHPSCRQPAVCAAGVCRLGEAPAQPGKPRAAPAPAPPGPHAR